MAGMPGRGGVTRGRGDAPMMFGEETDASKMRFKPMPMQSGGNPPLPGVIVHKGRTAPRKLPPEEFRGPERTGAAAAGSGGRASGSVLSPFHRKVVETYFKETAE